MSTGGGADTGFDMARTRHPLVPLLTALLLAALLLGGARVATAPAAGEKRAAGRAAKCKPRGQQRTKAKRRRRSCPRQSTKTQPQTTSVPRGEERGGGAPIPATATSPEETTAAPAGAAPGADPAPATRSAAPENMLGLEPGGPFRFFSPTSVWNAPVDPSPTALDPQSPAIMAAFQAEVKAEISSKKGPWLDTTAYSVPIYRVPADQPTVPVDLTAPAASLQQAFAAVPLPGSAKPAAGSDGHLLLWQPATDRLWEFWRLARVGGGWQASWGGAMEGVSHSSGVYGPTSWPGATRFWGASASSLSIAGGLITLEDLERGEIDHALAISVPNVRAGYYAAPAERTDGISPAPTALPEGAHLRLNPNLNLATLNLPPLVKMMARAAQRYGIVVRDGSPSVVSFYAQDPTPTGSDPYHEAGGYLEGRYPTQLLAEFPWGQLQLMKMELRE